MLAQGEGDGCGDALQAEEVGGAGLLTLVRERLHEVFDPGRAGREGLDDVCGVVSARGPYEFVEPERIVGQCDAFHTTFKADRVPGALRHDPESAGADPLHAGELRALDLRSDGRTSVEIDDVLLGLTLGERGGLDGVVLDVQTSSGEGGMLSQDARDDGDDPRSLPY